LKIRIKARVVADPCPYRETCCGACAWCETHSYSEACVPMLQKEIRDHGRRPRGWWQCCRDEHEICATEFTCTSCKETFCTSEMTDDQFASTVKYCPNCGTKMRGCKW
jgi:hypothetical protein